jgi:hypothetical protein
MSKPKNDNVLNPIATSIEGVNVPEIEALTSRVNELGSAVDFWNAVMIWGLALAALAALLIGYSTRLVVVRSSALGQAQGELMAAKDRQLQADLKAKDLAIAALHESAAALEHQNLTLKSHLASLRKETEARRLTGDQKAELANLLKGVKGGYIAIVSPITDGEASDLADDFDFAIRASGWETLRIKNRITEKFGVSVVTTEGTGNLPGVKLLSDALTTIGVPHDTETVKDGDASTSPPFQKGFLYLIVEHKPLPTAK